MKKKLDIAIVMVAMTTFFANFANASPEINISVMPGEMPAVMEGRTNFEGVNLLFVGTGVEPVSVTQIALNLNANVFPSSVTPMKLSGTTLIPIGAPVLTPTNGLYRIAVTNLTVPKYGAEMVVLTYTAPQVASNTLNTISWSIDSSTVTNMTGVGVDYGTTTPGLLFGTTPSAFTVRILDQSEHICIISRSHNSVAVTIVGPPATYDVWGTTNLADNPIIWELTSSVGNDGRGYPRSFDSGVVTNRPMRFYRAVRY